jgi:membrane protease YdiL (CAAX protease family)
MMDHSTNRLHFQRKALHPSKKMMTSALFRLLSICLLHGQMHSTEAFTGPMPDRLHASHLYPSLQLSAFHVSPLLRWRDSEPAEEQMSAANIPPSDVQEMSAPASSDTNHDSQRSQQSMDLIHTIWLNQGAILLFGTALATVATFASSGAVGLSSLHWNGGSDFHSFFDWNLNEMRLLEGVLATIPMVALGSTVENSDRREASQVNFSTINMVISLFGRRKSSRDPEATNSPTAMMLAGLIALSTGISEEMVFRGYIPTAIESLSHSLPLAIVGQAALFALAHISPKSSPGENKVMGSLQLANGLWYGVVYAASGGDILPCIIAHALYDMHVLCETWCSINKQMDYTQDAFQQDLDSKETEALAMMQSKAGPSLNDETLNFARRFFYAFDYEHKGSLCLSDVYRAVNYAFLQDNVIPAQEEVEDIFDHVIGARDVSSDYPGDRLTVSEFLRLLFTLKSKGAMQM